MRNIPDALKDHLANSVTTLATCWKITRKDDYVIGLTDHDSNLFYKDILYNAKSAYSRSALNSFSELKAGSIDLEGLFDHELLDANDLRSGLYDGAELLIFLVNYDDLSQGNMVLQKGCFGEITLTDSTYVAEFRSLKDSLDHAVMTERYSPDCRAQLGDQRCRVNLDALMVEGEVTKIIEDNYRFCGSEHHHESNYFTGGLLTWLSGENKGSQIEIKKWQKDGSEFTLFLPSSSKINLTDRYRIVPGCNKRLETCRGKFKNILNFRGEPYITIK
jgi:uncharacterized phage protein (TIGR02218 family)